MSLKSLHTSQLAIDALRHGLGLQSCSPSETRFEILRAVVWSLVAPEGKVHINRLLNASLPAWKLLSERFAVSEEILRVELKEALTSLEDAGDLIELSGGYWAPATTRIVVVPDGAGDLIVGGIPSTLLLFNDIEIQFHGPYRHATKIPANLADVLPLEDLQSWAKLPAVPLQDWAGELFASLERLSYMPTKEDIFEFYLPANSASGAPQFFRWFDSSGGMKGPLLARRRRLYGAREFRLVDVNAGRVVGACDLQGVDVRRLMYALDLAAKNPVRARRFLMGTKTEWLLSSEIPRAEQRTFAAFGTLTISDDHHYERRWIFSHNEEIANNMLHSLGIVLGT